MSGKSFVAFLWTASKASISLLYLGLHIALQYSKLCVTIDFLPKIANILFINPMVLFALLTRLLIWSLNFMSL